MRSWYNIDAKKVIIRVAIVIPVYPPHVGIPVLLAGPPAPTVIQLEAGQGHAVWN